MGTNLNLEKPYTLYAITSPNSDRIYFGITSRTPKQRMVQHRTAKGSSRLNIWMKANASTAVMHVILHNLSPYDASCIEQDITKSAINVLGEKCLNSVSGGNLGPVGCIKSLDTRTRISVAKKVLYSTSAGIKSAREAQKSSIPTSLVDLTCGFVLDFDSESEACVELGIHRNQFHRHKRNGNPMRGRYVLLR